MIGRFILLGVCAFFLPFRLIAVEKPLKVGMELAYPPFETIDQTGQPAGISVELANQLGKYLKRDVVIDSIAFVGLILALKNGQIDLIISSLSKTPERANAIDFSDPYLVTGLCMLISINSPVQNAADLDQPGRIVVVKQGSTGEIWAKKNLTKATVLILDREAACVLEVSQQKADAFLYDQFSVLTNWQKNKTTTRANLQPFQKEYWAIGVRKGENELLTQVNLFLKEIEQNQVLEKILEQFLGEKLKILEQMGVKITP